MGKPHAGRHNRDVRVIDPTIVLDLEQLREVTLEDDELMGQILTALIEDTARQIPLLEVAIREQNGPQCARLAHYSKGACANVGANAAAAVLEAMERQAAFAPTLAQAPLE